MLQVVALKVKKGQWCVSNLCCERVGEVWHMGPFFLPSCCMSGFEILEMHRWDLLNMGTSLLGQLQFGGLEWWGGWETVGAIIIFYLKLDFIFVHSETSILSCNPVLPLNFHLTVWELEWYKDVSWRWRRRRWWKEKKGGHRNGTRCRRQDIGGESEMEGGTQIPALNSTQQRMSWPDSLW